MIFKRIAKEVFKEMVDNTLHRAFEMRHKITHEANYMAEFAPYSDV